MRTVTALERCAMNALRTSSWTSSAPATHVHLDMSAPSELTHALSVRRDSQLMSVIRARRVVLASTPAMKAASTASPVV